MLVVWETHREDFPFTVCPLPSVFGPVMSVTLHSVTWIQNRFISFHSAAFGSTFRKWFIYHLKLDGEGCSVRKRELPHYIHYCLFRRGLCCIFIWFIRATPRLHWTSISGVLAAFCGTIRISEIQNGRKDFTTSSTYWFNPAKNSIQSNLLSLYWAEPV